MRFAGFEPLALAPAEDEAEVRQRQQDQAVQEDDAAVAEVGPVQRGADRLGRAEADGAADQRPEHVRDGDVLEPDLERDDQDAEDQAEGGFGSGAADEGLELVGGVADGRDEQDTREHEPGHEGLPGTERGPTL